MEIQKDLGQNIEGRHIIIIEDILDSGNTLNYLQSYLMTRKSDSSFLCLNAFMCAVERVPLLFFCLGTVSALRKQKDTD